MGQKTPVGGDCRWTVELLRIRVQQVRRCFLILLLLVESLLDLPLSLLLHKPGPPALALSHSFLLHLVSIEFVRYGPVVCAGSTALPSFTEAVLFVPVYTVRLFTDCNRVDVHRVRVSLGLLHRPSKQLTAVILTHTQKFTPAGSEAGYYQVATLGFTMYSCLPFIGGL